MPNIPQWVYFGGEVVPVGTAFGPLAVTGNGFVHVSSSNIDGTANVGTIGQLLMANATDTSWTSMTGDANASTSTPGKITITGLQGITLPAPSGTKTVLTYNSGAYTWTATGNTVTWASDLNGSNNTNQYVASLTGAGGTPGAIPLNASSWISQTAGNAFLRSGANTVLAVDGSGNTLLEAPSGAGVLVDIGATTVAQLAAANTDFIYLGTGPTAVLPNAIVFGNTLVGAPIITQANSGSSTLTVAAQSTGTLSQNGGTLNLASGAPGSGGASGNVVIGVNGPAGTDSVTFVGGTTSSFRGTVTWSSNVSPRLNQTTALSNLAASQFRIFAQSVASGTTGMANVNGGNVQITAGSPATANGASGSINLVLNPPNGTATEAFVNLTRGANTEFSLGVTPGQTGAAIYMGAASTANANGSTYTLASTETGSATVLNTANANGTVDLAVQGVVSAFANSSFVGCAVPVGGNSSVPFQFANTTQALVSNTNNTISSASFPIQRFTGTILGTTTRIILPAYRTEYLLDFTACLGFGANTNSCIIQATAPTKTLVVASNGVFRVYTDGSTFVYSATYV